MRCFGMSAVSALVVIALLGGCKSSESPIFFSSPASPYEDVPIPASFTLVSDSTSGASAAGNARFLEHRYQSTDALQPITQFFSDQLPKRGWILQSQDFGTGHAALRYVKGGEVLQIEVLTGPTIRTDAILRISPSTGGRMP